MWRRLRRWPCRMRVPTVMQVATHTDGFTNRNAALFARLPAAVGAYIFTFLSASEHGTAAESCRYMLALALQPSASPVYVELPRPVNVAVFTMPAAWRPHELAIYNTYVDKKGVRYLGVEQLQSLLFDNPRLHSLRLGHVYFAINWSSAPFVGTLPALRKLSLFGPPDDVCARLLECAAATLEHLRVKDAPGAGCMSRGERPLTVVQFVTALRLLTRLDTLVLQTIQFRQTRTDGNGGDTYERGNDDEWTLSRLGCLDLVNVLPSTLATTLIRAHRATLRQLYVTVATKKTEPSYARAVANCSCLEVLYAPTAVSLGSTNPAFVSGLTRIAAHALDAASSPMLAWFSRLTHVACTYSDDLRVPQLKVSADANANSDGNGNDSGGKIVACNQVRVLDLHGTRRRKPNREHERAYTDMLVTLFPRIEHLVLHGTCLLALETALCQRLLCLRRVTSRLPSRHNYINVHTQIHARMRSKLADDCPNVCFDESKDNSLDYRAAHWQSLHRYFTA
jgi:hypothetical protein